MNAHSVYPKMWQKKRQTSFCLHISDTNWCLLLRLKCHHLENTTEDIHSASASFRLVSEKNKGLTIIFCKQIQRICNILMIRICMHAFLSLNLSVRSLQTITETIMTPTNV